MYLWSDFSSNPIVVIIGKMNTRRNATQRLEEEIANVGSPLRGYRVPPLEEDANVEQVMVNPPPLRDGDIRSVLIQLSQHITTQAQPMQTQANL